jgi:hypothetical protein
MIVEDVSCQLCVVHCAITVSEGLGRYFEVACGEESWRFGGPNTYLEHAEVGVQPYEDRANEASWHITVHIPCKIRE